MGYKQLLEQKKKEKPKKYICPCTRCLCRAKCQHKEYNDLLKECPTIRKYTLNRRENWEHGDMIKHRRQVLVILNILKPTKWNVDKLHEGDGFRLTAIKE